MWRRGPSLFRFTICGQSFVWKVLAWTFHVWEHVGCLFERPISIINFDRWEVVRIGFER